MRRAAFSLSGAACRLTGSFSRPEPARQPFLRACSTRDAPATPAARQSGRRFANYLLVCLSDLVAAGTSARRPHIQARIRDANSTFWLASSLHSRQATSRPRRQRAPVPWANAGQAGLAIRQCTRPLSVCLYGATRFPTGAAIIKRPGHRTPCGTFKEAHHRQFGVHQAAHPHRAWMALRLVHARDGVLR